MEVMDRFAWHMRNVPGVQQVMTLPDVANRHLRRLQRRQRQVARLPRDSEVMRQSLQASKPTPA
jgi:hypothetical protein